MSILRKSLLWILLPVMALVLASAFLLFTTMGARVVASVAEAALEPLTIKGMDGSIANGLRADQVVWQQPEVTVTLDGLASVWNPACLWQGRICVQSLIAGRLLIDVSQTDSPPVDGDDFLPLQLPLLVIPWHLQVEQFYLAQLDIQAGGRLTRLDPVSFRAEWSGSRVVIDHLRAATQDPGIGMIDVLLSGAIEMRSEWPFDLVLDADYVPPLEGWQPQRLQLSGTGNVRNLLLQGRASANVALPHMETLALNAQINTQRLDLQLRVNALRGEWQGAPLQASGGMALRRDGTVQLDDLSVAWGENRALLNGALKQDWQIDAVLFLPQPELLAPDARGRFDGKASVRGPLRDPLVNVQLQSDELHLQEIQLQDLHLQATVAPLTLSTLELQLQAALLQWAEHSLQQVDVTLQGDHRAHTLVVRADKGERQLALVARGQLDPRRYDWHGQVESLQLQMNPDWIISLDQPVDLQWHHARQVVRWGQHCWRDRDGRLCSRGELDLARQRADLSLEIAGFQLAHLQKALLLEGRLDGTVDANINMKGAFAAPELNGRLGLAQLAFTRQDQDKPLLQNANISVRFQGQHAVIQAVLDMPAVLRWKSVGPVAVRWKGQSLHMPRGCWQADRVASQEAPEVALGQLCVEASATPEQGLSVAAALDLALAPALQPWLPAALVAEGRLQTDVDARLKGRTLRARLDASVTPGAMLLTHEDDRPPLRFEYESLTLQSHIENDVLSGEVVLRSDTLGNGSASASIDLRSDTPSLQGQARLQGLNLAILQPLLTQVTELNGTLNAEVQWDGDVYAPRVQGVVAVKDVQAQATSIPMSVDDLDARLAFGGDHGELTGHLKSGQGGAALRGTFARADTGWSGSIRLKGNRIPFFQPPDMRFQMQPDLVLTFDSQHIALDGNVLMNEGFVVIKPLPPGAVDISADVEFVDERRTKLASTSDIKLAMNVLATIEPSLRIRGFGAEVRPKGAVRITLDNTGVLTGRGTIDIEEGRYTGYGQRLTIRKGQVIFNGPLNQPYVNLEAVRVVDTVVAGIRVTGPASEPVATLFSEPSLPDSQILHYIITGKAPGTGTEADNTAVRSALLSLGIMGSQPLARDIASKVGIDDLQMGTTGSGDATAVTVSGYLNARTYLSYGMSVFEPVNTFTVRYRLRESLFLEAVSSIESALDVLYTFEF